MWGKPGNARSKSSRRLGITVLIQEHGIEECHVQLRREGSEGIRSPHASVGRTDVKHFQLGTCGSLTQQAFNVVGKHGLGAIEAQKAFHIHSLFVVAIPKSFAEIID
jgi:hypothetical protein